MSLTASLPEVLRRAAQGLGILLLLWPGIGSTSETDGDHVIEIYLPPPTTEARSTALFIAGPSGWSPEHATRAKRLSELHTLVIGIDGPALLRAVGGDCTALAVPLAELAAQVQQRSGALARMPVLAALADGSGLGLGAAMGAPERFKGLATESFDTVDGPCFPDDLHAATGGKAPLRWYDIVPENRDSRAGTLDGVWVLEAADPLPKSFYRGYLAVAGTDSAFDVNTMAAGDLRDLPLTIHHDDAARPTDTYAIFLSGDGGWAKFDEEVSRRLAGQGVPVVGISSLRHMWREKRPQQIAADIARIDSHFAQVFERSDLLLIGFSLGANTLPFAVAELPPKMRDRLAGVGLIAPETLTGFEIVAGGWLGRATGATEVAPAIDALDGLLSGDRIACLHGTLEKDSACPAAKDMSMRRVAFEGGHHLGHDHDRIARVLLNLAVPGQDAAR